ELVVGIFAVLMSGAGYLPIDVSVPDERKRFMSHDVGSFVKMDDHFVFDSCSEDSDRAFQRKALPPNVLDHNIAYVIFTSGSTGTPKGSLVSQKNVVRLFEQTNIEDRKSTRLNSSHVKISYAVFCLKKKQMQNL